MLLDICATTCELRLLALMPFLSRSSNLINASCFGERDVRRARGSYTP